MPGCSKGSPLLSRRFCAAWAARSFSFWLGGGQFADLAGLRQHRSRGSLAWSSAWAVVPISRTAACSRPEAVWRGPVLGPVEQARPVSCGNPERSSWVASVLGRADQARPVSLPKRLRIEPIRSFSSGPPTVQAHQRPPAPA